MNHYPKAIPALNDEQMAALRREMRRKPSKRDLERIERARKTVARYEIRP